MIRTNYQGEWMWLPQKTVCGLLHNGQAVYLDTDAFTVLEIDQVMRKVSCPITAQQIEVPMPIERTVEGGTFVRSLGFVYYIRNKRKNEQLWD